MSTTTPAEALRLHLGGKQARPGWKIFDVTPGPHVDFVGDVRDLSRFADGSCEEIYASHVLEHVPLAQVTATLQGIRRILKPGGRALISVPDLEVLARLFVNPDVGAEVRFQVMRVMFGGQTDAHDYHHVGFSLEILLRFLAEAGFARAERVESFGLFQDASELRPLGQPISLNVIATR